MENKIYLWDLYDYESESEQSKRFISKDPHFDLNQIPSLKMQKEIADFIQYRSTEVGCAKLYTENNELRKLCRFLQEYSTNKSSLSDKDYEVWMRQLKGWMMKESIPLTIKGKQVTGKYYCFRSRLITFFEKLLKFTITEDCDETEKDIWELDELNIMYHADPTRKRKRLFFTQIYQEQIRKEIKRGIYINLQNEALDCVVKELTALRRISKYLRDKHPQVQSCKDISRELMEEYIIYLKTEHGENKRLHAELNRLRKILEVTGQICGYPHLCELILTRDIPPTPKAEYRAYSDAELKRLNAAITEMNEQDARLLVIHQMLGTRISDSILLERTCLSKKQGEIIIRINQMKSHIYEKPISSELAALIQKAIEYSRERYGESKYIFVDEKDPARPIAYSTIWVRVIKMIRENDLRDDNGELFGFNSHMFRHCYGLKLTEMHLDDWTIAKLLGHKSVRNVQYYRKMSNKLMADETRKARNRLSEIILNNLDGWEDEYEQIRQNACLK